MNILVTLNSNYRKQLVVMLTSLADNNPKETFSIYIIHSSLTRSDFNYIQDCLDYKVFDIHDIRISDDMLEFAPVTDRFPKEMYYRIFAADYLPEDLNRILYLDPDIVVINNVRDLYDLDFENNCFVAASHVDKYLLKFNEVRLNMPKDSNYINSGVLLMNLKLLRKLKQNEAVVDYIDTYKNRLFLPDQDIISAIYGDQILPLNSLIYNLSDRILTLYNINPKNINKKIDINWVRKNSSIIHYCGKNKPWKSNYRGILDVFYLYYEKKILHNQLDGNQERVL